MKISIIIPTLNEEKLLPVLLKQLNDVRIRDNYDFEIIISDGGSTDNTLSIAERYTDQIISKDSTIRQNIGMGRNIGASQASGDVFVFLNGDIRISNVENFFQEITEKFFNSKKFIAMTCSVKVFPEEVKFLDVVFLSFYNNYFRFLNFVGLGMGRGECSIMRSEAFHKLEGYNEKLAAGEDFELYTRLRRKGKIYYSTKFSIYESPRRYRKYGHFRVLVTWLINGIFVLFSKRSLSNNWEEVR